MATVEVLETSITTLPVDAITNAANTELQNVGGVALAIVNAGGVDASGHSTIIRDECDKIMARRSCSGFLVAARVYLGVIPATARGGVLNGDGGEPWERDNGSER